MIPIKHNIDGVVTSNPELFSKQPLYIPCNYLYGAGLSNGYMLSSSSYLNEISMSMVENKTCFVLKGSSAHQSMVYVKSTPIGDDTPDWQWAFSFWAYTGKEHFSAGANNRWIAVYFAQPEYCNQADIFRGLGDWWQQRKTIYLYLGKTSTTDNFRFRVYCDSYVNGSSDSSINSWRKYGFFTTINNVGWHLFTFTVNGSTVVAYCDNASTSIDNAVPDSWLTYKAFSRVALCQQSITNYPTGTTFGTARFFNYSLTQQQHLALYNAGF